MFLIGQYEHLHSRGKKNSERLRRKSWKADEKIYVREYDFTEDKEEAASGSKEWPTGSNTQQSSKLITIVSFGFDKWLLES